MNSYATDLRKAAHKLKQLGIDTGERRLIAHLVERGAIRKTLFGYEVAPQFRNSGYFVTDVRHAQINDSWSRDYTVVQVTPDGFNWLRDEIEAATKPAATSK